jgi:hypothetical protein
MAKEQKLLPAQRHAVKGGSTSRPSYSVVLPVSKDWHSAKGQTLAKEQKLFPAQHLAVKGGSLSLQSLSVLLPVSQA